MQEVTSKNAGMSKEGSDVEPSAPVPLVFPVPTVPAPDVSPTAVSSESAKDLPLPTGRCGEREARALSGRPC